MPEELSPEIKKHELAGMRVIVFVNEKTGEVAPARVIRGAADNLAVRRQAPFINRGTEARSRDESPALRTGARRPRSVLLRYLRSAGLQSRVRSVRSFAIIALVSTVPASVAVACPGGGAGGISLLAAAVAHRVQLLMTGS